MQSMNDWEEVVSPLPKAEASAEYKQWRMQPVNALISDEDIRMDTIRSSDGKTLVRYLRKITKS